MKLYERFCRQRDENDSIVIVGLDPKVGNSNHEKRSYALSKIKDDIVGFKPNLAFYQEKGRGGLLRQIGTEIGADSGLIRLLDAKVSDGANTNRATLSAYSDFFDYVTIAPAGGCFEETIDICRDLGMGTVAMGVMSFPGVLREINEGLPLFKERVLRCIDSGVEGFVMGATSYIPEDESNIEATINNYRTLKSDKPITVDEMDDSKLRDAILRRNELFRFIVENTEDNDIVYLVPGFGRQGGKIENFVFSGIDIDRCMMNLGSDIFKVSDEDVVKTVVEYNNQFRLYRKTNKRLLI